MRHAGRVAMVLAAALLDASCLRTSVTETVLAGAIATAATEANGCIYAVTEQSTAPGAVYELVRLAP